MKTILIILIVLMSLNANTSEKRNYVKINSANAQVKIETQEQDTTQAANYVDGKENAKFIQDMLLDKKSILNKLKSGIEKDNCNKISTPESLMIEGCGQVTITNEVRTSFGRSSWATGGGSYTFFIGFTNEGSGRYFDVSHMVTISERAEAQMKNGRYSGVVIKTLILVKIKRIDELTP